jgi:hypothetical protein
MRTPPVTRRKEPEDLTKQDNILGRVLRPQGAGQRVLCAKERHRTTVWRTGLVDRHAQFSFSGLRSSKREGLRPPTRDTCDML